MLVLVLAAVHRHHHHLLLLLAGMRSGHRPLLPRLTGRSKEPTDAAAVHRLQSLSLEMRIHFKTRGQEREAGQEKARVVVVSVDHRHGRKPYTMGGEAAIQHPTNLSAAFGWCSQHETETRQSNKDKYISKKDSATRSLFCMLARGAIAGENGE